MIASWGKQCVMKIYGMGGIKVIINDLQNWPNDENIQLLGCQTIANMATHRYNRHQNKHTTILHPKDSMKSTLFK